MKHRKRRIKMEHAMIPGLREYLESATRASNVIRSAVPGEIRRRKGGGVFSIKVQYVLGNGVKCLASSGGAVQEVFLTGDPVALQKLIG